MPYAASVYQIMIASPGDVEAERGIASDVIHEWNCVHSRDRSTVLMPLKWETHSTPEMGDRPQAIINKQVLKDSDILIAIFWTRIGTPTGQHISGTVEEIEEHLEAGRPAMIYFSSAPVRPDSVDDVQYSAVKEFRESCKSRGLYESYDSADEFRAKLNRQLAQKIIALSPEVDRVDVFERALKLSGDAADLLTAAAADQNGMILVSNLLKGTTIQANDQKFGDYGPKEAARWKSAIDELDAAGLIEQANLEGTLFSVTKQGYDRAAILPNAR